MHSSEKKAFYCEMTELFKLFTLELYQNKFLFSMHFLRLIAHLQEDWLNLFVRYD